MTQDDICYLNHRYFASIPSPTALKGNLLNALELFRSLGEANISMVISEPFWDMPLGDFFVMHDLIYTDEIGKYLSREQIRELTAYFGRIIQRDGVKRSGSLINAEDQFPIADGVVDLALRESATTGALPLLLLSTDEKASILANLQCEDQSTPVYILATGIDLCSYYRESIRYTLPHRSLFLHVAEKAFPNLLFHNDIALEYLEVDLHEHIDTIICQLAFLNDEYDGLGSLHKWEMHTLQRVAATKGVIFSTEGDKTKRDQKKINLRNVEFTIDGKTIVLPCVLHTKITPTLGRIHFHNPHACSNGRVMIGIFCGHLPI